MDKKVLIIGAGMVSPPIIRYLLDQHDIEVTVADLCMEKAEKIINNHPHGNAINLDVSDGIHLKDLISKTDVVVSLLPYDLHVRVALFCIKHGKHLVTTSYVSEKMKELDGAAREADVLLLNECGLDPGIDHMSAMRIIHSVEAEGEKVISFKSTTGAMPSHEANTNPFGYKFSWSPRGVLLASCNSAKWLEHGNIIQVPGKHLFENYFLQDVPGVGTFENYPNRDSVIYKEIYGLDDATTVYRGTFRLIGWCEALRALNELGWLKDMPLKGFSGTTYADVSRFLLQAKEQENIIEKASISLGLKTYAAVMKRLEWLGLFNETKLPPDKNTPLDYLNALTLAKMSLGESERDMIVMHHEIIVAKDETRRKITASLIQYGDQKNGTAVSKTVALPAAIAVHLILTNKIKLTGVHIPVKPEIYTPILNRLEQMGIRFFEKSEFC